jgi:hypothetical protein
MASAGYHRPSSSRRPTQRRVPEELEASATLAVGATTFPAYRFGRVLPSERTRRSVVA